MQPTFYYRFRSVDALIGKHAELLNQEIYFSELSQLNDPMEGWKDIYWSGDTILWSNLIKHYILCLELVIVQATIGGPEFKPDMGRLILTTASMLPAQAAREIHEEICKEFFSNTDVASMPGLLSKRTDPVRRDELFFYLKGLQTEALFCVVSVLQRRGLFPKSDIPVASDDNSTLRFSLQFLRSLNENPSDQRQAELAEKLFRLTSQITHRTDIAIRRDKALEAKLWWTAPISSFPEKYVAALQHLISFDWYIACFVSDPHQAAMWGHYGDSHRGICLKFRALPDSSDQPSLSLKKIVGWSGGTKGGSVIRDFVQHPFLSVHYQERFPTVDFFRSLARTPTPTLNRDWYSDGSGSFSPVMRELHDNLEAWRTDYWSRFDKITRTKLIDWEHEKEYRLVLSSGVGDFADPKDRKLTYKFEDLSGIIFGMGTPIDDRVKIVEIIEQKCKEVGRSDFEFLQASYSHKSGKIETHSLFINEDELRRPIGSV